MPQSIHLLVDKAVQSVDRTSQKSVKLDPNAYETLTITKKSLEKYLRENFSYGDTVRWLCYNASEAMSRLYQESMHMNLQLSEASGTNPSKPDIVRMFQELEKSGKEGNSTIRRHRRTKSRTS
jgi:hypothetical protein